MANSNTNGYKAEGSTARSFSQLYAVKINDESEANAQRAVGKVSLGVRIGQTYRDWNIGSFRETGNTYDLALAGHGFFKLSMTDKSGTEHIRYTRDGSFSVDTSGYLVTKDGDFVLDDGDNKIQIPAKQGTPSIDQTGRITIDGKEIAKIGVTDFEDYNYLQKYGENMFDAVEGATTKGCTSNIQQGVIETSNVNIVDEMVNMISVTRAYETNQKVIQTADNMLDKAVNTVGRL